MKIAAIRKINEKMPYWMKRPFAGLIRGKLINNEAFLAQYRELEAADTMSVEEKERLQMEKLRKTLIHAYEHTAYYKELFDKQHFAPSAVSSVEELAKLPILTKEALKEHYTQLQADDIDDFYEVSTGGTTGAPTHVLMERVAIYREYAFTYHFWSKFGYDYKSSKLATFRGVDLHDKLSEINPLYQEIRMNVFLMNRNNIKEYVKRINGYGADFAYGYPSAVYNFCRLAHEAGVVLAGKFKAALLISENLYEFQEKVISEVLSCPIAMFYGHSERAVYAEKYGEGYAFDPLYGVTEIDKDNMPIVTGFINRKTPLIRYKVDDEVRLLDDGAFEVTGHRDSEVIYGANGKQFRATMLDFHGMISKKLSGFQFVQEVPGELTLRILKENECPDEIEEIRAECERKLGKGAVVRVEMVDSLNSYRGGVQVQDAHSENTDFLTNGIAPIPSNRPNVLQDNQYRIVGHWNADLLEGKNGEQISAAAINFHDGTFKRINSYQFIQKEPGKCILIVVPGGNSISEKDIERIGRSVSRKFGGSMDVEVRMAPDVILTDRGKYKMVIKLPKTHRGGG